MSRKVSACQFQTSFIMSMPPSLNINNNMMHHTNRPFANYRGHLEMETNSCILKRYFFVFDFKEIEDVDQLSRYFTHVLTDAWRCHLHC